MQKNSKAISAALFSAGLVVIAVCSVLAPNEPFIFELPRDAAALAAYQTSKSWLEGISVMGLGMVVVGSVVFIRGVKKPHTGAA